MTARLIVGERKYDTITPILKELHWLPVAERIKFKVLILMFKGLYMAPQSISSMLSVHKHSTMHRSNLTLHLYVSRTKSKPAGDPGLSASRSQPLELHACMAP